MSVHDEQQRIRDFIDALREALGLLPLYKQPEPSPPMVETRWSDFAGNRRKVTTA